jgi:hypothetical protein
MKFKEYKGLDLPGLAADVLKEWDAQDTFHKSISTREEVAKLSKSQASAYITSMKGGY